MKSPRQHSNTPTLQRSPTRLRIIVLADDLTGATELAGAALAHGLTAEVQTRFDPTSRADVVALDTDTRSRPADEAARIASAAARAVFRAEPSWVYKKTDSVLRGHARAEIEAIVRASGGALDGALLVPANPSRGRVIRGGEYFVAGVPLDETAFARDPEHPRHTARVAELLGPSDLIRVPDTAVSADLAAHAASLEAATLPAGGVDFFATLLAARCPGREPAPSRAGSTSRVPTLFVCGSAAAWRQGRAELSARHGIPCRTLPDALLARDEAPEAARQLAGAIHNELRDHSAVMLAIGAAQLAPGGTSSGTLATRLAAVAAEVAREVGGLRYCAEGGATARALIDCLGWTRMDVVCQWAPGTVELRPRGTRGVSVVCKVGSYDWPEELFSEITPHDGPFETPVATPIDGVLDLHTFRPEDLGELIPEYLEQCRARGLLEVRIIHGKGIGNVRRSVVAILARLECVERHAPAGPHFGGAGATVVRLRAASGRTRH